MHLLTVGWGTMTHVKEGLFKTLGGGECDGEEDHSSG